MPTNSVSTDLLDSLLQLAAGLTPAAKLDLIARLSADVRDELPTIGQESAFTQAFGAFISAQTAEEIIEDLRNSRTSTRQIEAF